ncbi:MAG TPA: carbon storage regulator [Salinisphaeraceae bacterium]|nr:carbon storage regulator [Salinisphaeraceae bacterium]
MREPNMLVITRQAGETLLVGEEVSISVLAVEDGMVRLRIEAPRDIEIHRSELLAPGQAGNLQSKAATVGKTDDR